MKSNEFNHDFGTRGLPKTQAEACGENIADAQRRIAIRAFDTHAPLAPPVADPRRVQLLALYDASAEADKLLLIQIAKLHADRNAARGK